MAGTPVILTEFLHGFPESLQLNVGIVSRLSHNRVLSNPFQLSDGLDPRVFKYFITHAVSCRLLVAVVRIYSQGSPCGVCEVRRGPRASSISQKVPGSIPDEVIGFFI
jgi:hypothetical protein